MSVSFDVRSASATYSVTIEAGLFAAFLQKQHNDIFIADEWFANAIAEAGRQGITLPADEVSKSLDAIPNLVVALRNKGANRETVLVAVGGGTIQDVAAFIASVYMRGLQWTYFPTTLLAMADSCIGGKSSINVGPYKNLVGTFHPPHSVFIDPSLVSTLDDETRISGLVEAAKICYCRGADPFFEYMALSPRTAMSVEQTERVIYSSLQAKKWFIEVDEFDKAERLQLNFGHTFGHAFEGASHFRIPHGISVAIGIVCAITFGKEAGRSYVAGNRVHILEEHLLDLLAEIPELLNEIAGLSISDILDRLKTDKKHGTDFYVLAVVAESGAVEIVRLPKNAKSLDTIQAAIEVALDKIKFSLRKKRINK
jgi:3-dehydroquinate synthase